MFYKEEPDKRGYLVDTTDEQKLVLKAEDEQDFGIIESIVDVPSPWFRKMLEGTNPETTIRSLEFSPTGINIGYNVDFTLRYRTQAGHALTEQAMLATERMSRRVNHKVLPFLAPGEMGEPYFFLNISVVSKMKRHEEEVYQAVFNPASYMLYTMRGVTRGTGAYGEPMMDEVFIEKKMTDRPYVGYRRSMVGAVS